MKDFIKNCKDANKLIAVYTNKDNTEKFSVGYILEQIEEGLLIASYDSNGLQDRIILLNLNDIFMIETDSLYLKKMYKLINNFKFINSEKFVFKRNNDFSLLYNLLNQCFEEKKLITIKSIFGFDVSGLITEQNDDVVIIQEISNYGEEDGLVCIKIEDIEKIGIDGQDEQKLSFLRNNR